jgi:hypothetical protein
VVHDTTEIAFKRSLPSEDMGHIKGGQRGFFLHVSLVIEEGAEGLPLGLVDCEIYHRPARDKSVVKNAKSRLSDPNNESLRWHRGVMCSGQMLSEQVDVVHVMDREADDYKLFARMEEGGESFVIRQGHNRLLDAQQPDAPLKLFELLHSIPSTASREVVLSKRAKALFKKNQKIHPPRDRRMAKLDIRFADVALRRPDSASKADPSCLGLQVVHVFEREPPVGQPAIDWKLLTNLPVTCAEEALKIVDIYRQRWTVEEYFKALKTGTNLYSRQMESVHAIHNVVALAMPLAWRLLVLRAHSRRHPTLPATKVLTELQLEVLRKTGRVELPKTPTLLDVSYAIAALAGHLKRNGPPGWLLLADGLYRLTESERVWRISRSLRQ